MKKKGIWILVLLILSSVIVYSPAFNPPNIVHAQTTSGLTDAWHFDESGGSAIDSGPGSVMWVPLATGMRTSGVSDNAALFNGTSGTAGCTLSYDGKAEVSCDYTKAGIYRTAKTSDLVFHSTDSMTFSIWVKPNDVGRAQSIFATDDVDYSTYATVYFFLESQHKGGQGSKNFVYFDWVNPGPSDQTVESTAPIPFGQWTHVAIVKQGASTLKLYINGALSNTASVSMTGSVTSRCQKWLGAIKEAAPSCGSTGAYYFNGAMDEFLIYHTTLSNQDIQSLFNQKGTVSTSSLSWQGSYISTYYSNLPWNPRIAEIHISAADALTSGTIAYAIVVQELANGGEQVSGYVPIGSTFFQNMFKLIGQAVSANPDGSFDFTAMEVAGGIGWFYGGSFSQGTLFPVSISYWPIPIPLFSLQTPGYYKLYYSNTPVSSAISSVLAQSYNAVDLLDQQGRLGLTVQDSQGRQTGFDAALNSTVTQIPGSSYVEYGPNMVVVLPGSITSFTYIVNGASSSQNTENYSLALENVQANSSVRINSYQAAIMKGSIQSYSAQVSGGSITYHAANVTSAPGTSPFPFLYVIATVLVAAIVVVSLAFARTRGRRRQLNSPSHKAILMKADSV